MTHRLSGPIASDTEVKKEWQMRLEDWEVHVGMSNAGGLIAARHRLVPRDAVRGRNAKFHGFRKAIVYRISAGVATSPRYDHQIASRCRQSIR